MNKEIVFETLEILSGIVVIVFSMFFFILVGGE